MNRYVYIILFFAFFCPNTKIKAQGPFCAGGGCLNLNSLYSSSTASNPSNNWSTLGSCFLGGNYLACSVVNGQKYEWSTCNDFGGFQGSSFDAELTLFNSGFGRICFNDNSGRSNCPFAPYIGWTANYTGVVYVLVSNAWSAQCQNWNGSCATVVWRKVQACTNWAVTPSSQNVTASGGNFSATVTASGVCLYNLTFNNSSWIHFTGYGSNGVFNYSVDQNTGNARTGTIEVNNVTDGINNIVTLTINQSAGGCPTITASTSISDVTGCSGNNNGSIMVTNVSGGTSPYQYSKNNGSSYQSSNFFSSLSAGTYQVKVRDNNNCLSTTYSVSVDEPDPVDFSTSHSNATCGNCSNGSISVFVSGGVSPYQYSKNSGGTWQSASSFTGLVAGTYNIRVKDANGCLSTIKPVTIIAPPVVSLIIPSNNNINSGESISFSAIVSNNPSGWNWSFEGGDKYSIISSQLQLPTVVFNRPGTYKVSLKTSNAAGFSNFYQTQVGFITVKPTIAILGLPKENYVIQQGYPSKKEAEPVNVATGSYEYSHTDFNIPAINTRLQFTRFYNSVNVSSDRSLGYGWTHSYDYSVTNQDDSLWVVHYGDGHSSYFIPIYNGNGISFPLSHGTLETLKKNTGTGAYTLTYKTGEVCQFNSSGKISSITDLNGNNTTFNYTGNNLTAVTAPGGRTLTLTYNGARIASVSDQISRIVSFSYDGNGNMVSVTDVDSGVTGFSYDANHRITAISTPLGDTLLSNQYNSSGKVIAQSDAYQNTTTFSYNNPDTEYVTITYPDNSQTVIQHDSLYRLVNDKDELNNTKTYSYDINNRPIVIVDENGVRADNSYDTLGNLIEQKLPENATTTLIYNSLSRPTRIVNPKGDSTLLTYDGQSNLAQISLPGNRTIQNTYYSNGLLKTSKDPLGRITYFYYNAQGDLTSIVSPSGTKNFIYDSVGRLTGFEDENHYITTYAYNKKDKLIKITDALGYTLKDSFDINDNLVTSIDKNGNETKYKYDKKDRLEKIIQPNSGIQSYEYDERDNVIKATDPNGNAIDYDYDDKKRLSDITNSLGTTKYGYDNVGNKTSLKDPNNNTTHYKYDSLYRLDTYEDALSNKYAYSYSLLNQNTSIKDPLNRTTQYEYNPSGFLTKVTDALNHDMTITRDVNGNITSIKDLNGHTQNFSYDLSDRLIVHKDAENNIDSFKYDNAGNLIQITKPTGTITRTFDSLHRLIKVVNSSGDVYEYTYDGNDDILSIKNNAGTSFFSYDNMSNLVRYVDLFGDTVKYEYDLAGNRTKVVYPGGLAVTYGYNGANLLDSVTDWLGHTTVYKYDAAGQLTAAINPFGDTCKYVYDNAGRLTSLTNMLGDSIISQNIFTLNVVGEKVSEQIKGPIPFHLTKSSYAYTYEDNDALVSDSITTYTNDGAGNRLNGDNTYTFTVDNLLKSKGSIAYTYDALGNRLARGGNGSNIRYLLDLSGSLSQVLQERDSSGIVNASYIYGLGLIARIDSGGNIQYYHFDAQHNTIALSDDSGRITDTYVFESFGLLLEHIGNTEQPYTFLGQYGIQQEDSTTYYIRARYYDAANQRFLSKDSYPASLSTPQTLNRYVYGLNNPISVFDLTGLFGAKDNSRQNILTNGFSANNIAKAAIGAITADIAVPEPSDAVLPKWAVEAVIGGVALTVLYSEDIVSKMEKEIGRLLERIEGPPGFQYALVATRNGNYPNVRGGTTYLSIGDVWKYGETTSEERYTASYLNTMSLQMIPQFFGSQVEIKIQEKVMIYGHFFATGSLPPGNKIFR